MSLPAEAQGIHELATHSSSDTGTQTGIDSHSVTVLMPPPRRWSSSLSSALVLMLLGAIGSAYTSLGIPVSVMPKVTGILGFVCAGFLAFELADIVRQPEQQRTPLTLIPFAGALLFCVGAIWSAFDPRIELTSTLVGAPALCVGAIILVRAIAQRMWCAVAAQTSLIPGFHPEAEKVVAEGTVFPVSPDMLVPTDGRVRSGSVAVLERYLSPDTHFRVKDEAEVIFAGSYVLGGRAEVEALTNSYESCLKRLEAAVLPGIRWIEDSLRREHEKYVVPMAYVLLFCAVTSAIFWNDRGAGPGTVLPAGGVIFMVALLGVLAEVLYAQRSSLVRSWAQRGFLLNSPHVWTELSHTTEIAYDPSRLDTTTSCRVTGLELFDDRISEHSLCGCIASLVGRADDRALSALGDYCQQVVGTITPERVVDLREYAGRGISGSIKGVEFSVGSEDFLVERGILIQPTESAVDDEHGQVVLVAIGDDLIGRFWMSFGQPGALEDGAHQQRGSALKPSLTSQTEREVQAAVLLVRGAESDALGREHSPSVALLRADSLEVPTSSVVAMTSNVEALPSLVHDVKRHVRSVLMARSWVLFCGFVSLTLVFSGVISPLIPLAGLPIIIISIIL